ncbi:MAG: hypothetical protein A2X25_10470 [Chloroflexi bacterium GWB2_49_20]|nr:MAG: hypothetical protein A2X25_10470 [Chloroflexi bacterium GWB2_49_20]OGN79012.1 MAG: hypothetical protein A2X26_00885 [Chloroflexi bacterium GWC2_49_37]OGN86227.1 MAG: hypothetical protein A2X27_04895 [Chloroflexi bacterium GWD2_49_16]
MVGFNLSFEPIVSVLGKDPACLIHLVMCLNKKKSPFTKECEWANKTQHLLLSHRTKNLHEVFATSVPD